MNFSGLQAEGSSDDGVDTFRGQLGPNDDNPVQLSETDIVHNVRVNVLVAAVFQIGAADIALAGGPLLVYLGASNTLIGIVNGLGWVALIGLFLSPYISRNFQQKKWYMFWAHVPYIGAWGLIGLAIILSANLGISNTALLSVVVALSAANLFFSGFVTLPCQEFLAACIPMSYRGRYTGYSMSVGAIGSIISVSVGGLILFHMEKPMSFGWLYLIFWTFAQGGFLIALLAREPNGGKIVSPLPWSRQMLRSLREDTRFQRVWASSAFVFALFSPCMVFVPIYGYKELGLPATTAAVIALVQQISRLALSSHIGIWTDRIGPKIMAPFWFCLSALSVIPLFFTTNSISLYITVAIQAVCFAGVFSAFNPLILGTPKPSDRSGHYSAQLISQIVLTSIATILAGLLIDRIGYLAFFAGWSVASLLLTVFVKSLLRPLGNQSEDYS